jgi:hypothetical protein
LLVGQIISPGMIARAFGWLKPVWAALMQVLMFVLFVLAYLFFGLFEPLLARMQRGERRSGPQPFQSPLGLGDLEELSREPIQIPPIYGQILRAVLIAAGVALLVWLFMRAVRRRAKGTESEDDVLETRETILSLDLVRSQLSGLLNGLRGSRTPPLFVGLGAGQDSRRLVRELYQRVLARAVELDVPRRHEQTPARYQRSLLYLCSSESEEVRQAVETLTAAYEVARYGVEPPTSEQVRAAQSAYARIDAALQSRPSA